MIYDPEDSVQQLGDVVDRALAAAGEGSPLRAVHAGRAAVALGRELFAKSEYGAGIQAMTRARKAIATAVRNRPHDSLVEAEFELASLLYRLGRAELASPHCSALLAASPHLSDQARELHPRRLLSCGLFEAHHGGVAEARALYSRALMVGSQVSLGPDLQTELLLRLAALAHLEVRDSEEEKLFERVLPLVGPSDYPRLKELLIDAYAPLGSMQPSSAAARLAYVAARLPDHHAQASPLHSIAERLSTLPPPASR
jgi:tetratricopeptide (TPR) repeat protein